MIQCILCHIAILDGAKGGEDGADVVVGEVLVDRGHVQTVEGAALGWSFYIIILFHLEKFI